ncbi:MAG: BtpA family membrane complex biogenesis protein [Planctomycetota bacterium]|nr:MAG: BtpA family membrane complex biogenesis protein [Planctomycetota bacterium]
MVDSSPARTHAELRGIIGMVHVGALPGTPRGRMTPQELVTHAVREARTLRDAGFDAIMLENMHDRPYLGGGIGAEIVACMAAVCAAVRAAVACPIGIQILGGGSREALAVAHATGLEFVRAENFVFAHVADEGLMTEAAAGPLLRFRKSIGADHVQVFADIKKKHAAHAITGDIDIAACARAAEFFLADGVIVTGTETGAAVDERELNSVRAATKLPVFTGSGATTESVARLLSNADAVIVGSFVKEGGRWEHAVCPKRAADFVNAARGARRVEAPGMDAVRAMFSGRPSGT